MGDILGVILLIVLYGVAASAGKKNKKAWEKRGGMPTAQQTRQQAQEKARRKAQRNERREPQRSQREAGARMMTQLEMDLAAQREADCGAQRMHLHDTTGAQRDLAAEGEDPCHKGGVRIYAEEEPVAEQRSELAQDVLRGVIMSEILTRPAERAALAQMRRRR